MKGELNENLLKGSVFSGREDDRYIIVGNFDNLETANYMRSINYKNGIIQRGLHKLSTLCSVLRTKLFTKPHSFPLGLIN